jgi:MFS family permease
MLIRFSSATFLTRVSVRSFLLSALALGGVTSLVASFANNYLSIVFIIALSGLSYGIVMNSGSTLVARYSTPENRAVANSIYISNGGLGNIMKVLTTPIVDTFGLNSVFLVGSISVFAAIIPLLLRRKIQK